MKRLIVFGAALAGFAVWLLATPQPAAYRPESGAPR